MILILIVASWTLAVALVTGLCAAASRGDLAQPHQPCGTDRGEAPAMTVGGRRGRARGRAT